MKCKRLSHEFQTGDQVVQKYLATRPLEWVHFFKTCEQVVRTSGSVLKRLANDLHTGFHAKTESS